MFGKGTFCKYDTEFNNEYYVSTNIAREVSWKMFLWLEESLLMALVV